MNPLSKKKANNSHKKHLTTGRHSDTIKALQQRIQASPLDEVNKLELSTMLEEMTARSIAFDIDTFIKDQLIKTASNYDSRILSYQADMIDTQRKLADREKDMQFHKTVLLDLKKEYLETKDRDLLQKIDDREKAIAESEKLYNNLLDLRNKMRKELDKKEYNERTLKIQEEDHESKVKTIEINSDSLKI